jgi:hypothetical protein
LKKSHKLFQEAERLQPPPDLWRRIEAESGLASGKAAGRSLWERPYLRAAAAVVLAAGAMSMATLVLSRHDGKLALSAQRGAVGREAAAPMLAETVSADSAAEVFDPELLGWQADLGEYDLEADEAGEVL